MTKPTQPAVSLSVNGEAFSLRFDFDQIALAEEITDRPLLTGLRRRDIATPSINLVRGMLFACLLPEHPSVTYAQASALVSRANIVAVWAKVLAAWELGLAEPSEGDDDAVDPRKGQS